jgi:hypothetical protein
MTDRSHGDGECGGAISAGAPISEFDRLNPTFPNQHALDQTIARLNPKTDTFAGAVMAPARISH